MLERLRNAPPEVRRNVYHALGWLVFCAFVLAATGDFDGPVPTYKWGAAFWPRAIMVIGIIAGVCLLVTNLTASPATDDPISPAAGFAPVEPDDAPSLSPRVLAGFAVPLIYAISMHYFGFLLTTPVFLAVYMVLLGVKRPRTVAVITVALSVLLLVVFVKLVFTPLPQGVGFFNSINGQIIGLVQ